MITVRLVVAVFAMCWVGLFVYNSGYGYDALELLVPARHIAEGHPLYALTMAKPLGPYLVLAGFATSGVPFSHATVTAFVVVLLGAAVFAGWWYARAFTDTQTADAAAVVIGVAGMFMELNFLVVEGGVVAAGFLAAGLLGRFSERGGWWQPVTAGLVIGAAFYLKQTVAFYAVGSVLWLGWYVRPWQRLWRAVVLYAVGGLVAVGLPAFAMWSSGHWRDYLDWTFIVPLTEFPASREYIDRLYTKLGWFTGLCGGTVAAGLLRPTWAVTVLRNRHIVHLVLGAFFAAYPVLKSQAPHYVFPFAAFVSVPVSAFWVQVLSGRIRGGAAWYWKWSAVTGLALLIVGSVATYRPSALARLVRVVDYNNEAASGERIRELVPADRPILALTADSLPLYFHAQRYPNVPIFHFDVQTQAYLKRHPNSLVHALDDDSLNAVLFDSASPPEFRYDQMPSPERRQFWDRFEAALRADFVPSPDSQLGPHLWIRRATNR